MLCAVCLEHQRETVLVPCGHVVLCAGCCQDIRSSNGECPLCREQIEDEIQIED
ncbi:MAG: hypothetical protein J3K34DRAFT_415750 [Monoraphidium minutum]|nr:MAG: hypothetical protein J3K34DRAFT_415750 [Monoraphidium minutum]